MAEPVNDPDWYGGPTEAELEDWAYQDRIMYEQSAIPGNSGAKNLEDFLKWVELKRQLSQVRPYEVPQDEPAHKWRVPLGTGPEDPPEITPPLLGYAP
jgi:hypothetical protein